MDSHSRSASPRDPPRPQHRPPSPPTPTAFDNRGYQHDEADPNHNDSFNSNGPQQNGHSKEPNGDTKTLEAVNLELINLTPKNGSTKKKDVEVDMNATNPYDEYFVPVNEHRKYMRGEKLYVTADKRGEKGGCKRPLCWTLLGLVVAVIVALIVLAATGILFTNSPTPVEQYNVSSARAFGGIGHIHDHDHDHDHHHDHDDAEPPTEQHGPETQDDQAPGYMNSEENGDSSMYVPRTVEGELKIDNERFVEALKDPESKEYKEFVANFNYALKWALFDRNTLERGDNDIMVEVVDLKNGSVIVTYRIHWKPKTDTETTDQLLTPSSLKTKLNNYLDRNNRILSVYHVAEDKTSTKPVLDLCQINKNDCEYGCEFDETNLDFICICPRGLIIDSQNPKRCIPLLETPVGTKENNYKVLTIESNPSTMKPTPEEEKPISETVHVVGNENFDWKETHHIMPETTTESDTDLNFSHIFGHSGEHHDSEMSKTESSQEHINPSPEPEPTSEPEPNAQPEPAVEPKSEPEPNVEHMPESNTESKPEPTAEPEPEPVVESKPEPEPTSEPQPSPELKTSSEVESSAEVQPITEPQPTSIPTNVIMIDHHSISESDSDSSVESADKLRPAAEPVTTAAQAPEEPLPTSEPQPAAEPQPEPAPEPEPTTDSHQYMNEYEHETKQKTDSMEIRPSSYDSEQKYESESSDEKYNHTNSEITTVRISISEPNVINEPSYEPKPEIISILNNARKYMDDMTPEIATTETSTDKEWLENDSDTEKNKEHIETENRNITDTLLYTDLLNHNGNVRNVTEIEQRSFKTLEDELLMPTTTEETNKHNNEKSLDLTTKRTEILVTELPGNANEENEMTTEREITTIPVYEMHNEVKSEEQLTKDVSIEATTMNNKEQDKQSTSSEILRNSADETIKEEKGQKDENSIITSVITDENVSTSNFTTTTIEPEIVTEYSISKHVNEPEHDKELIEALNKSKNLENKTSTERTTHDEGAEITFDAINMLYNRSSKSMENKKSDVQNIMPTEENEDSNDTTQVTTESDWLSEFVTEINYEEAMNKMEKHYETTESTIDKIDEIMNHGVTKDDFEPDYLNNMGTSNKMQEPEVPIYGMVHDYDSDDSRVKRVNHESKETATEAMMKDTVTETDSNELPTEINFDSNLPIESTTVSEYIYKTAEKSSNESYVSSQSTNETMSVEITSSMSSQPAPVWEDESESEHDLSVKELPKSVNENVTTAHNTDTIDKISIPMNITTTHPVPMTIEKKTISENSESFNNTETSETSESNTQNTTQGNNLNVTIYEISSHNGNHSYAAHKQNSHSAEYDDHETEMNPFLPEIEENKSLVKKLQEGHDIEPINMNDTQNETIEEHSFNSSEGQTIISNGTTVIKEHKLSTTTEDSLFNVLLMNVKPQQEESDENKDIVNDTVATDTEQEKIIEKQTVVNNTQHDKPQDIQPISTFLIDTDDLDNEHTTEHSTTTSENNLKNDVTNPPPVVTTTGANASTSDTTEYLQVVPITQERLEEKALKKNNSENMQELNDISDSPKKSDRRTLDATKLESTS